MDDVKNRRAYERLEIPGMKAVLVSQFLHNLLCTKIFSIFADLLMKQNLLKNISVNGACIQSKNRFNMGDPVHMIISLPEDKKIPVKGNVRWTHQSVDSMHVAGIQFLAFSKGKSYNSLDRLKQLNNFVPPNTVQN